MVAPKLVLIDVDTGVDDAWALAMIIKAEHTHNVRVLGITTVSGNTSLDNATRNTVRVLETLHRTDIPVYKGAREALIPNPPSTDLPWNGYNGFGDVEFPNEPNLNVVKSEIAATAMHRFVVQHPKQVTLLCCGPMTNVALALRMYPDFGENVKEIYIMGGNYQAVGNYKGSAEFNFYTDVESAHIALSTLKCPITMCAWESATEDNLQLETSWRFDVLGAVDVPFTQMMNPVEFAITEPRGLTQWPIIDGLMVAAFLFPDQVVHSQEKLDCVVDLHGWLTRGQVAIDHLATQVPNVNVIKLFNLEAAKAALLWTVHPTMVNLPQIGANAGVLAIDG